MDRFKFVFTFLIIAALAYGCTQKQVFDRRGWNDGDGLDFPRRDLMVDDLLQKYNFKGMKFKNVVGLLKWPQRFSYDSTHFHYQIILNMEGLDTIRTKNLVFGWNKKDSIITDVKVTEKDYPRKKHKKK